MDYSELFPIGTKEEVTYTVDEQFTARHIGSGALRVLATPAMIGFMESKRTRRCLTWATIRELSRTIVFCPRWYRLMWEIYSAKPFVIASRMAGIDFPLRLRVSRWRSINSTRERSTESTEQLLARLQDWCQRAEASGIRPLVEFSQRLRCYAL